MKDLPAITGTLFPREFVATVLSRAADGGAAVAMRERAFSEWWKSTAAILGPAASLRTLCVRGALPLLRIFGWHATLRDRLQLGSFLDTTVANRDGVRVPLLVGCWNVPLEPLWRDAVRTGLALGTRWTLCFNGTQLLLVDAQRTYSRRFVQFDLAGVISDAAAFRAMWSVVRADALMASGEQSTAAAVELGERHAASVCSSLRDGVRDALTTTASEIVRYASRRRGVDAAGIAFGESLTIVYRILFLLFAEARDLVPVWHPVYRDSYTVGLMCDAVRERGVAVGIWEGLQATMRLAHAGCEAGDLKLAAFNGALFAPGRAPIAASAPLSDLAIADALRALTTREDRDTRTARRISYVDLGVEQLGAVYEHVLDYVPRCAPAPHIGRRTAGERCLIQLEHRAGTSTRKTTGTFYTPRSITDFLVRRTLAPLVREKSTDRILALRVLDPAMGSGAFLVGACRYLAAAYETAAITEGQFSDDDITEADRAGFRRSIAQRCLFGVDVNPTAVELAKLSLWLTTLAADKPLNFLDHHLRAGDSLLGASLEEVARQFPGSRRRAGSDLPLFPADDFVRVLRVATAVRRELAEVPDDTASVVREKEARLRHLTSREAGLARWKSVLDFWCACWFWPGACPVRSGGMFGALAQQLLGSVGDLPLHISEPILRETRAIAASHAFFHWPIEFPEVFADADGRADGAGFDAVLGNPPWDVVRADTGDADARERARGTTAELVRFVRRSGIYRHSGAGHPNRYQLFVERALHLVRPGGRLGLVLPSGLMTDSGSASLRRVLLDRCETDLLVSFDNRDGLFPIHRSVRFVAITAAPGGATTRMHCRFGERDPSVLDRAPDIGSGEGGLTLTASLVARACGPDLTIPDVRHPVDVAILDVVSANVRVLRDPDGWNVRFGRELNASDDKRHFVSGPATDRRATLVPVIEGKHLEPFRVHAERSRVWIARPRAASLLDASTTFDRPRLGYRDVASSTNRLTLIAAIVPAGVVTTHTVFCAKGRLSDEAQDFLCGALNSYVANYLVRQRVSTHVSASIIAHLQVPCPPPDDPLRRLVARIARQLSNKEWIADAHARMQAAVAELYGLTRDQFAHVLTTFPLLDEREKQQALAWFMAAP